MKRPGGQISIFLALSSLLVFALFCTLLEGARYACLNYLCRQASSSALESVFAAYDGDLLEQFGLLACRGREADNLTWTGDAEEYLAAYLMPAGESSRTGTKSLAAEAVSSVYLTEGDGRIFADAVLSYMESGGSSALLKTVLNRFGITSQEGLNEVLQLIRQCSDAGFRLDNIIGSYRQLKEKAQQLQQAAEAAQEAEEPADTTAGESSGVSQETSSEPLNEDSSAIELLEELKELKQKGILYLLTGDKTLSELSRSSDDRPSQLSQEEKSKNTDMADASFSAGEKLLLCEYMLEKMSCYVDEEDSGYEAEYILTGAATDTDALKSICSRLLVLRCGLNFVYLSGNETKRGEAKVAAAALVSLVAAPELLEAAELLILLIWSAAEAVTDVRALLQDKRVPLMKTDTTWRLQALSFDSETPVSGSIGLEYRDYLRLFFYLTDGETTAYRMMDVIQQRLRSLRSSFSLCEYMVSAELSSDVTVGLLYLQIPAFGKLAGAGKGRIYHNRAVYSYRKGGST